MDFVVAGILIGAFLVGIGLAVRDLGARRRPRIARNDNREIPPETLARAWRRFCQGAGTLLMTLGLLVLLATVLAMVLGAGDRTGLIVVAATSAFALLVIAFAALTMPKHYRQGRFDAVVRRRRPNPRPVIEQDISLPLGGAAPAAVPDPFDLDPPAVAQVGPPGGTVRRSAEAEAVPVEPPLLSTEPTEQLESLWPAGTEGERSAAAWESANLDDELPAWGAPRVEPESAPEASSARQRRPRPSPGGFESSLFEDLPAPAPEVAEADVGGPFKSRLLNELASDVGEPNPDQADVLLDEFPLPNRDDRDGRNAGNSR